MSMSAQSPPPPCLAKVLVTRLISMQLVPPGMQRVVIGRFQSASSNKHNKVCACTNRLSRLLSPLYAAGQLLCLPCVLCCASRWTHHKQGHITSQQAQPPAETVNVTCSRGNCFACHQSLLCLTFSVLQAADAHNQPLPELTCTA
jgi:hypothetical protein